MQTKQFVRDATGLVREFGAVDTLLFASAMVFALVFTIQQFAWFYGSTLGASLPLTLVVAAIPFVFLMLAYWAIGVVMPRTGNDYLWVGRIFRPSIGFAWAALYMFVVFFVAYVGEVSPFATAFSSAFTALGLTSNSASLIDLGTFLGSSWGTFMLAALFTLLFGVFAIFGNKLIKGFMYTTWIVAIIGMILMWYILGSTSNATFASNWNQMIGSLNSSYAYSALQSTAINKAGFPGNAVGFAAIVTALPFAFLFLFGGNYANAFAGEIKNVKRSIPVALFLSLIFGVIYWSITSTLTLNAINHDWITPVGYAWLTNGAGSAAYPLPYAPTQTLFLAVAAYPNNLLISVMFFTYLVGSLGALFAYFWIPSKYFFAWAFDRVIPSKFANVSSRFNTPYVSILAIVVLGVVLSYLYLILGYFTYFTLGTVLWGVSYIMPALALMAFPYVKKDLFATAPGWVGKKVAGIPLVTLVGLLTAIGFGYVGFVAYTNPLITAPNVNSVLLALAVLVVAFVVYFASRFYHKGKGMDISMALKEIPPE
ncbi:MAG: amino acid permease [Nitrososphaerales archaeon]|nr:amino acid permease [Nitrososphaerales archaeon]